MENNWFLVVSFKTELLSEYLIHRGYRDDLPYLLPEVGLLRNRMIIDNDVYIDLNELKKVQDVLSKDFCTKATQTYLVIEKQSLQLIETVEKISKDIENLNNEDCIKRLKIFFKEYQKTLGLIGIPTIIDLTIEPILKKYLKESNIKNIDDTFGMLAVSEKIIDTNKERYDLLNISLKQKEGFDISKIIEAHENKYGWLHSTLFLGEQYAGDIILKELNSIVDPKYDLEKLNTERKSHTETAEKIIESIIPNEGKKIARLLQKSVYIRTARLEWLNQSCFIVKPFLILIAKKIGLSLEDLVYLLPEEIYLSLSGIDIDKNIIKERQKGYALISNENHDCSLFVNNELEKIKKQYNKNNEKTTTIKGLVACKGKVTGQVVIVKDRSEISKIKENDILVTVLTTPDFIAGMRKSSAVITDLGGMTSHAAIVARELKKPCIVGTKNATKILKDGDIVEVDAINGIISIIIK